MRVQVFILAVVALFAVNVAYGGSIDCTNGIPGGGFTCDIDVTPNSAEVGPVQTPSAVSDNPGNLFWAFCAGTTCNTSPLTWTFLLEVTNSGSPDDTSTVEVYSLGCGTMITSDTACFPTVTSLQKNVSLVNGGGSVQSGIASNVDGTSVFDLSEVPEPATLPLIGGGLVVLGFLGRLRTRKA
jgi:hypothetical protein